MDIAPHIPVIDKSKRDDGTFSRKDFTFDQERNVYVCPAGKTLTTSGKLVNDGETILSIATMRRRLIGALVRSLPRCPCCNAPIVTVAAQKFVIK